jgi:hypothetical protein
LIGRLEAVVNEIATGAGSCLFTYQFIYQLSAYDLFDFCLAAGCRDYDAPNHFLPWVRRCD